MQIEKSTLPARALTLTLAAIALGGCVAFSPDGGFDAVGSASRERGLKQEVKWIKTEQDAEKRTGSSTKAAWRAADRGCRRSDRAAEQPRAAGDLRRARNRGSRCGAGRAAAQPGLLVRALAPRATRSRSNALSCSTFSASSPCPFAPIWRGQRFELTQGRVTAEMLQVAADTRRAWHERASPRRKGRSTRSRCKEAAEASAELARRMAAAGNFSKLDHAREQVFYAEATAQLARARTARAGRARAAHAADGSVGRGRPLHAARSPARPAQGAARDRRCRSAGACSSAWMCRARMKEAESIAASLGLTQSDRFHQRARARLPAQQRNRPAAADGLRDRTAAADLRLGRRARSPARNTPICRR